MVKRRKKSLSEVNLKGHVSISSAGIHSGSSSKDAGPRAKHGVKTTAAACAPAQRMQWFLWQTKDSRGQCRESQILSDRVPLW